MEIEWVQLFGGGIGGLVGGTVVGFIGRFYLGSYMTEKAKMFARSEDIELLRTEIQVLTKEAETIKATISHEMWDKQRQLEMRRDAYIKLIEALGEVRSAHIDAMSVLEITKGLPKQFLHESLRPYADKSEEKVQSSIDKMMRAIDVAPLLVNEQTVTILREMGSVVKGIDFNSDDIRGQYLRNIGGLETARWAVIAAAADDLGLRPVVSGITRKD